MASFQLSKTRAVITASGKRKIKAIETEMMETIERRLRIAALEYKKALAEKMPDAVEEAQLLSVGTADVAVRGRSIVISIGAVPNVGTPTGGRFQKIGMLPLREAILRSSVTVTKSGPRTLRMTTAKDSEINRRSGFSWKTHQHGIQGPTFPFNHNLMQAMNDGGVWEVTPRGGRLLNPEDGVLATRMIKTLHPRRARETTRAEMVPKFRASLKIALKRAVKRAGG